MPRRVHDRLVIVGCGGHGRSVAGVVLADRLWRDLLFVDPEAAPGERVLGFPTSTELPDDASPCFVAIGDNARRRVECERLAHRHLVSVVSSRASLGKSAQLGTGCFVATFAYVGPEARVGDNAILNTACVVEHEARIGAHAHIGPHATVCGRATIGDSVFVGAGATVRDYVRVCDGAIVGAGAVVVSDILGPGTYVGCPARRLAAGADPTGDA